MDNQGVWVCLCSLEVTNKDTRARTAVSVQGGVEEMGLGRNVCRLVIGCVGWSKNKTKNGFVWLCVSMFVVCVVCGVVLCET